MADGRYVYVAGDEVLGLPDGQEYVIAPEVSRAHLAYDENLSVDQAIKEFWKVLERDGDVMLAVWGFMLIGCLRSLLVGLDITTYPSLVVVGKHSAGKTTVCQRFGLLFNKDQDERRAQCKKRFWANEDLKSSAASTIEIISQYRDQAVLVDDMAKSISPDEVYKRKKIMADVLRFASNGTERNKMSPTRQVVEQFCTAGVMFTSELELNNSSDIGRTITVHIRREMQDGEPRDREVAATVFRYFILWLLSRLDEVITDMNKYLSSINGRHQRLQKNKIMILRMLTIFMTFVREMDVIPDKKVNSMYQYAGKILDSIVAEQIEQIEQLENRTNISYHILTGIQDHVIERVSEKAARKGKNLPIYYYVRPKGKDDTICMRTDVLYSYLTNETPLRFSAEKSMDQQLLREGVVHRSQDGRVASTRINNRRYLGMRRVDLVRAASTVPSDDAV